MNIYIDELCIYADELRGKRRNVETTTIAVEFDIFCPAGGEGTLASVAEVLVQKDPVINMGIYRYILERKISNLKVELQNEKDRVEKLEGQFAEELRAEECDYWAKQERD